MPQEKQSLNFAPSTQGRAELRIETPSFRITEASYEPKTRFPTHAHEHPSLTAVFEGGFVEQFRKNSESCSTRSILIKPAAEAHSNDYGDRATKCLLVGVTQPIGQLGRVFERTIHLRGGRSYSLLMALREELRLGDDLTSFAAEGLLLELLARIARESFSYGGSAPKWVRILKGVLRERCCKPISLADVGTIAGVHPAYATRMFRKHYGCTPIEFVRRCRIDWATNALCETELSISAISASAGFSDQSHFTRAFTRLTGRTPNSLRQAGSRNRGSISA
jgi:AraC family transcriptional regulator